MTHTGYPRTTLLYWLMDVEGMDGRTAALVLAMDKTGPYPRKTWEESFPRHMPQIERAFDGLYSVVNDV